MGYLVLLGHDVSKGHGTWRKTTICALVMFNLAAHVQRGDVTGASIIRSRARSDPVSPVC